MMEPELRKESLSVIIPIDWRMRVNTYGDKKFVTLQVAEPFDPASLAAALRVIHF